MLNIPWSYTHFDIESIWIELIVVETENWKHCNKIIFKCVNSIVGPIFNIFKYVNRTATIHKQYINSAATVLLQCQLSPGLKQNAWSEGKKKEKKKRKKWKNAALNSAENAESKRAHRKLVKYQVIIFPKVWVPNKYVNMVLAQIGYLNLYAFHFFFFLVMFCLR